MAQTGGDGRERLCGDGSCQVEVETTQDHEVMTSGGVRPLEAEFDRLGLGGRGTNDGLKQGWQTTQREVRKRGGGRQQTWYGNKMCDRLSLWRRQRRRPFWGHCDDWRGWWWCHRRRSFGGHSDGQRGCGRVDWLRRI